MSKCFLLVFFTNLATSCSGHLNMDTSPAAYDSMYPTAEITACGAKWNGVAQCLVSAGQPLKSISMSVQGYYDGTMTVKTDSSCPTQYENSFRYQASQEMAIDLPGLVFGSCKVGVLVQPDYPKNGDSSVEVHPFYGYVWVFPKREGKTEVFKVSKIREDMEDAWDVEVGTVSPDVRTIFKDSSCSSNFDQVLPVKNNMVHISAKSVLGGAIGARECRPQGGIADGSSPIYTSWLIAGYKKDFTPLSTPSVSVNGSKIDITADSQVAIVAVNSEFSIGSSGSFDWNAGQANVIRILTSKGRSVIGVYTPGQEINWLK